MSVTADEADPEDCLQDDNHSLARVPGLKDAYTHGFFVRFHAPVMTGSQPVVGCEAIIGTDAEP
jgi:hypothetical protein